MRVENLQLPGPPASNPSLRDNAPHDRRAQSRRAVDAPASIFLIDVRARLSGRMVDLSLGGCRIRTWERFPVGIYRRVETEFTLDGLPFRLAGVVQTIHDRRTVGIRFLDMSSRKRDQLAQSLRELEEHPAEDTRAE
jgi:c-di-GMP-binding flagellar brake protein YcgR